jgi:hypothetical protein
MQPMRPGAGVVVHERRNSAVLRYFAAFARLF